MSNLNYNKCTLAGRITADPEIKMTPSGIPVCNFSIAINRRKTTEGGSTADFFACVAWRQTADFISKWFHKGDAILVEGSLQSRFYTERASGAKRYVTELLVSDAVFVDSRRDQGAQSAAPAAEVMQTFSPDEDYSTAAGDLPF